ncbi:hypothetical protein [Endozoicomonas montiporae]|uniref:hypothetical protein n=1 Tax=Endozoicomonas montiporae TaxID=1027273 RepID=UPI001C9DDFEB|nr:hypothetical protein [Endozoicomonas montiporae]
MREHPALETPEANTASTPDDSVATSGLNTSPKPKTMLDVLQAIGAKATQSRQDNQCFNTSESLTGRHRVEELDSYTSLDSSHNYPYFSYNTCNFQTVTPLSEVL